MGIHWNNQVSWWLFPWYKWWETFHMSVIHLTASVFQQYVQQIVQAKIDIWITCPLWGKSTRFPSLRASNLWKAFPCYDVFMCKVIMHTNSVLALLDTLFLYSSVAMAVRDTGRMGHAHKCIMYVVVMVPVSLSSIVDEINMVLSIFRLTCQLIFKLSQ